MFIVFDVCGSVRVSGRFVMQGWIRVVSLRAQTRLFQFRVCVRLSCDCFFQHMCQILRTDASGCLMEASGAQQARKPASKQARKQAEHKKQSTASKTQQAKRSKQSTASKARQAKHSKQSTASKAYQARHSKQSTGRKAQQRRHTNAADNRDAQVCSRRCLC